MNDADKIAARIEALEMRIAYQDRTIEDLNASVTEQWKRIDNLVKQIERMGTRLQEIENKAPDSGAEPPPPHY